MWQLRESVAEFDLHGFRATINLSNPSGGIFGLQRAGQSVIPGPCLGIEIEPHVTAPQLADCYVRDHDLVAVYHEQAEAKIRPHIYWRLVETGLPAVLAGVEVIMAFQTSVLDARPRVAVNSQFAADKCWAISPTGELQAAFAGAVGDTFHTRLASAACAVVARLRDQPLAYLEMLHPADFVAVELAKSVDAVCIRSRQSLATNRLEKGVIRQCRVRSLLLERNASETQIMAAYQQFIDSPPPLTT